MCQVVKSNYQVHLQSVDTMLRQTFWNTFLYAIFHSALSKFILLTKIVLWPRQKSRLDALCKVETRKSTGMTEHFLNVTNPLNWNINRIQSILALDDNKNAPIIIPSGTDITALPGQNLTLRCVSSEPVKWKIEDSIRAAYAEGVNIYIHTKIVSFIFLYCFLPLFQNNKYLADFNPIATYITDGNRFFESSLELRNIDYTFVGHYYCVKNSSSDYELSFLLQIEVAARIYLFVEGMLYLNRKVIWIYFEFSICIGLPLF